jgi:hypothetical protein
MRQTMMTVLFGGLLAIGASLALNMQSRRKAKIWLRSLLRVIDRNPWMHRIVMKGVLRRIFRRLQLAR